MVTTLACIYCADADGIFGGGVYEECKEPIVNVVRRRDDVMGGVMGANAGNGEVGFTYA